jgi:ABC-type amino acid transport substrate-binding protein
MSEEELAAATPEEEGAGVPEEELGATPEEAGAEMAEAAEPATPEETAAAELEEEGAMAPAAMPEEAAALEFEKEGAPEEAGGGMSNAVKIVIGVLAVIAVCMCLAIGVILLVNAFNQPEATAVPSVAVPTEGTTVEAEDSWERVQAAGQMMVGTAADYPPFEYYVAQGEIDGFDIALMDEIGRRLGVTISYRDFAFDGLIGALQLGQLDAAIAAISVTSERQSQVDFTSVYLAGKDAILAQEDSTIGINSVQDLAQYKVGVERATVYATWLQTELVDTGLMPASNLFAYQKAGDALRDLKEGRIDLFVLDAQPAEAAVGDGGVKIIASGLNVQYYAIALPKGAHSLREQIDGALADMHADGTVNNLAQRYLGLTELLPTPTPGATSTPAPTPSCVDGLTFVQDVTEGGERQPGESFSKVWRVQNTGTCTWDNSYRVVFVNGNVAGAQMGGQPTSVQGQVAPGQTYDMAVNLVAPLNPGSYEASWQMENGQGQAFGERLQVAVTVIAGPTATPMPTQTPNPDIAFTVDRDQIQAGQCVNFSWNVTNASQAYFFAQGENWQDNQVPLQGSQMECPPVTTAYFLRVVLNDNQVQTRQITIYVEPAPDAPHITRFTVDPPGQILLGQCVMIRWTVEGDVSDATLLANDIVLWLGAPTTGSYQDCPTAAGRITYNLTATGPGGSSQASETISVVDSTQPTATTEPEQPTATTEPEQPTATTEPEQPTATTEPEQPTDTPQPEQPTDTPQPAEPTNTPQAEQPVIYAFLVTPSEIQAGQTATVQWRVGGGATYTRILRDGEVVVDDAGFNGNVGLSLTNAGTYNLVLEAYNSAGEMVSAEQTVTVTEPQ